MAYENLFTVNVRGISGQALITQTLTVEELTQFVNDLKRKTEAEVKKKERLKTDTLASWIADYLWDFPHESKNINEYSVPVLRDRLARLPLPEKLALKKALTEVQQWKSY